MSMRTMMNAKSRFNRNFSEWLKNAMDRVKLMNVAHIHLDSQTASDYYAVMGDYYSKRVFNCRPTRYDVMHRVEKIIRYYETNSFPYLAEAI